MHENRLLPIVLKCLHKFNCSFTVLECDEKLADTGAFCEHYGYAANQSANTILVVDKKDNKNIVACVLLADSKLDVNKKVCQLMGTKRASFASAELTRSVSGMEIGGVTVFGLPERVPVFIDERVLIQPKVIMGGGNRTSKIVISSTELTKLSNASVINNLALSRNG
jgi:prolyl-tRNA editing enzyme YbaK/EbsC (Cys-tRNA(Pro) deacylase)